MIALGPFGIQHCTELLRRWANLTGDAASVSKRAW